MDILQQKGIFSLPDGEIKKRSCKMACCFFKALEIFLFTSEKLSLSWSVSTREATNCYLLLFSKTHQAKPSPLQTICSPIPLVMNETRVNTVIRHQQSRIHEKRRHRSDLDATPVLLWPSQWKNEKRRNPCMMMLGHGRRNPVVPRWVKSRL